MPRKILLLLSLCFLSGTLGATYAPYVSLGATTSLVPLGDETWVSEGFTLDTSLLSFERKGILWAFPVGAKYLFPSSIDHGLRIPRRFDVTLGAKMGYDWGSLALLGGIALGYEGYPEEKGGLVFFRGTMEAAATYPIESLSLVLRSWCELKALGISYGTDLLLKYTWRSL